MNVYFKIVIWVNVLLCLFWLGFSRWSDKEMDRQQHLQDSIITENHRIEREIEWKRDSARMEFEKVLDTLITKANKYDILMNLKDGKRRD